MPNDRVIETIYIGPFSSVETVNAATLFHPGEIGARTVLTQAGSGSKEYQLVQVDSGTAVTPAAGMLAYWKNKPTYLVTVDAAQAIGAQSAASTNNGFRNEVAGVLTVAATPGNFTFVQQKGNNTVVKLGSSSSPNPGDFLVASTTANSGAVVTAGTAPTVTAYGKFLLSQTSVTTATVDLDIPGIP